MELPASTLARARSLLAVIVHSRKNTSAVYGGLLGQCKGPEDRGCGTETRELLPFEWVMSGLGGVGRPEFDSAEGTLELRSA